MFDQGSRVRELLYKSGMTATKVAEEMGLSGADMLYRYCLEERLSKTVLTKRIKPFCEKHGFNYAYFLEEDAKLINEEPESENSVILAELQKLRQELEANREEVEKLRIGLVNGLEEQAELIKQMGELIEGMFPPQND